MTGGPSSSTSGVARAIGLDDQAWLEPLLQRRWHGLEAAPEETLSDPWFANLYLFRAAHDWRVVADPHPRLLGRTYDGTRLVLPLFDLAGLPLPAARALLEGHDAFGPFSAAQARRLPAHAFGIDHDRNDSDYLYPAHHFVDLPGRQLGAKRGQLRQLQAAHRVQWQALRPGCRPQALAVLDGWLADKGLDAGAADDAACREALELIDMLGLRGLLFHVDGEPAGFVVAQCIAPGVHVMRFAKGRDCWVGLYPFMFRQFCLDVPDVQWLNFEQDLGRANFRRAKRAFRPVALLHKLRARPL